MEQKQKKDFTIGKSEALKKDDCPIVFTKEIAKKYSYSKNQRGRYETIIDGITLEFLEVGAIFVSALSREGWIEIGQLIEGISNHEKKIGIVTGIFKPGYLNTNASVVLRVHFIGDTSSTSLKPWEVIPKNLEN